MHYDYLACGTLFQRYSSCSKNRLEFQDLLLGKAINPQSISQQDLTDINEEMVPEGVIWCEAK